MAFLDEQGVARLWQHVVAKTGESGNKIYIQDEEPVDAPEGSIWFDTNETVTEGLPISLGGTGATTTEGVISNIINNQTISPRLITPLTPHGGGFWEARDNAIIVNKITANSDSLFPVLDSKTLNGSWSVGTKGDNNNLYFNYIPDASYANGENTDSIQVSIDSAGNFSGNAANVTGTVAIANGGTGATTLLGARYNLLGDLTSVDTAMSDTTPFVQTYLTPSNENGGVFVRPASVVWDYIKGKNTGKSLYSGTLSANASTSNVTLGYNFYVVQGIPGTGSDLVMTIVPNLIATAGEMQICDDGKYMTFTFTKGTSAYTVKVTGGSSGCAIKRIVGLY